MTVSWRLAARSRRQVLAPLGAAVNSIQNPAYSTGMEARFAAAARHSRMVRLLRVAVPAAVLLAMAGVVAVSVLYPFRFKGLSKMSVDICTQLLAATNNSNASRH